MSHRAGLTWAVMNAQIRFNGTPSAPKPARQRLGEVSVRGASVVTRGQASRRHTIESLWPPSWIACASRSLSPGFLHVEDSASRLGGLQQGVPPGAQLDEVCFGAALGVLGGAKLWLGGGVGLLPLAWCHPLALAGSDRHVRRLWCLGEICRLFYSVKKRLPPVRVGLGWTRAGANKYKSASGRLEAPPARGQV